MQRSASRFLRIFGVVGLALGQLFVAAPLVGAANGPPTDAQAGITVDGNLEPIYSSNQADLQYVVTTDTGSFVGVIAAVETQEAYYIGFQQAFTTKSNVYCDDKPALPGCYQVFKQLVTSDYISFRYDLAGTPSKTDDDMEIGVDILSDDGTQPSGFSGVFNKGDGAAVTRNVSDLTGVQGKSAMDYNMNVLGWYSSFGVEHPDSPNFTPGHTNDPYIYPSIAEVRLDKSKLNLPANFNPLSASVTAHNSPDSAITPPRALTCETLVVGDQSTGQNVTIGRLRAVTGALGDDGEKVGALLSGVGSIVSVGGTPGSFGTTAGGELADVVVSSNQVGTTSITGFWDLDGDSAWDTGLEPITAAPCQMRWAPNPEARIRIDPPQDANQVGNDHTFTVTVTKKAANDQSFGAAANVAVTVSKVSGPGSFRNGVDTCTTNGAGQCDVTMTSSATGLTTVSASADVSVDNQTIAVSTNGQGGNSAPAVKRWVDARLVLTPPQDANRVGDTHTFTAHLMFDHGAGAGFVNAPAGETISFTKVSGPGTLSSNSCATGADGTCTVELVSDVTGLSTLRAAWSGSITTAEGVAAASTNSGEALKRWANAKLTLTPPKDANEVGDTHTFTADLEFDVGDGNGFVDAKAGETITFAKDSGPGALSAATCTTDAAGRCTVNLMSTQTGLTTVHAAWNGVIATAEGNANASATSENAIKRWVRAHLDLTPPEDANQVGDNHVFTADLNFDYGDGQGSVDAPSGETITVSKVSGPGTLGAATCTTDAVGRCTVTLTAAQTGLTTVAASWSGSIATAEGAAAVSTVNDDAVKRWVQARLSITPPQDANHVGDTHTFVAHLEFDTGSGFGDAPAGQTINFSKDGIGALSSTSCVTAAGGTCSVELNSLVAGLTTVHATWTGAVATAEGNASATAASNDAVKRWIDARLTVTPPSAVNRIGDTHTFTAHLEFDTGSGFLNAPAGETVGFTKTAGPGSLSASSCTTDGAGTCTVDLVSDVTGTTALVADWNGIVATAQGNVAATAGDDASKRWVDALILINPPEDTNEVGDDHVFTITVNKREQGNTTPAAGVDVKATITSGPGSFVGGIDSCTTDAAGECTVTIGSDGTGLTVVRAEATVTVDGLPVLLVTDGQGQNGSPAVKRWVDARLAVSPPEATNVIGDSHTFAAHLEFDNGDGNGFVDAPAGELISWTKTSGPGSFVSDQCMTAADGVCTVQLDSDEVGTTEVEAAWAGSVTTAEGSAAMTRADTATKDWVEPAIRIIKTANPIAGPPRTVTFTYLVTNIGDVTLTDVEVNDDVLGIIGTIASLAPGESATLEKDADVDENSPRINIGTACGDPTVDGVVIGDEVCDDDPAEIAVVLPVPPRTRPELPTTGFRLFAWVALSTVLVAAGLAMMQHQRIAQS